MASSNKESALAMLDAAIASKTRSQSTTLKQDALSKIDELLKSKGSSSGGKPSVELAPIVPASKQQGVDWEGPEGQTSPGFWTSFEANLPRGFMSIGEQGSRLSSYLTSNNNPFVKEGMYQTKEELSSQAEGFKAKREEYESLPEVRALSEAHPFAATLGGTAAPMAASMVIPAGKALQFGKGVGSLAMQLGRKALTVYAPQGAATGYLRPLERNAEGDYTESREESVVKDAAVSSVLGPVIELGLGKALTFLFGKKPGVSSLPSKLFDDSGNATPELMAAIKERGITDAELTDEFMKALRDPQVQNLLPKEALKVVETGGQYDLPIGRVTEQANDLRTGTALEDTPAGLERKLANLGKMNEELSNVSKPGSEIGYDAAGKEVSGAVKSVVPTTEQKVAALAADDRKALASQRIAQTRARMTDETLNNAYGQYVKPETIYEQGAALSQVASDGVGSIHSKASTAYNTTRQQVANAIVPQEMSSISGIPYVRPAENMDIPVDNLISLFKERGSFQQTNLLRDDTKKVIADMLDKGVIAKDEAGNIVAGANRDPNLIESYIQWLNKQIRGNASTKNVEYGEATALKSAIMKDIESMPDADDVYKIPRQMWKDKAKLESTLIGKISSGEVPAEKIAEEFGKLPIAEVKKMQLYLDKAAQHIGGEEGAKFASSIREQLANAMFKNIDDNIRKIGVGKDGVIPSVSTRSAIYKIGNNQSSTTIQKMKLLLGDDNPVIQNVMDIPDKLKAIETAAKLKETNFTRVANKVVSDLQNDKTMIQSIANRTAKFDEIVSDLTSADIDQVGSLTSTLTQKSGDVGKKAHKELVNEVMAKIRNAAFTGKSINGLPEVNPYSFKDALLSFGKEGNLVDARKRLIAITGDEDSVNKLFKTQRNMQDLWGKIDDNAGRMSESMANQVVDAFSILTSVATHLYGVSRVTRGMGKAMLKKIDARSLPLLEEIAKRRNVIVPVSGIPTLGMPQATMTLWDYIFSEEDPENTEPVGSNTGRNGAQY